MALSAAEQQEMNQLESEVGGTSSTSGGGLSASEQAEMDQLQNEVGHVVSAAPSAPTPKTPDEIMAANAKSVDEAGDASNNALLNTLTFGHLAQIKAKAGQLLSGEGISNDANYVNRRDAAIAEQNALAEQYPVAHAEGKIAGFLAPVLATGMGAAAEEIPAAIAEVSPEAAGGVAKQGLARTLAKGAAKGSAFGGAMGLAQNPGDTAGVVDPYQVSERLQNAKTGAEVGAVIGAPLEAIPNAAEYLQGTAEKKALKGAGAMLKDFRKEYANDSIQDTGRFILDNGLVTASDTYGSTAQKASTLRDATGQELGKGYDAATKAIQQLGPEAQAKVDAAGFNPVRDKQAILDAAKSDLGYSYGRKNALNGLSNYLDELIEEHGNKTLNPAETNNIKTALDQSAINYNRNPLLKEPDAEAALKTFRGALSDKVSGQIQAVGDAMGDPNAAQRLSDLNSKYGMAAKIARISGDRSQRDAANAAFGLKEFAGAEFGGDIGHAVAGTPGRIVGTVVGAGAGHLAREVGPSTLAGATDTAANVLRKIGTPSDFLKANPAGYSTLQASANAIANKNDSGDFEKQTAPQQPDLTPAKSQPSAPTKGPAKWANDGLQNLIQHSGDKSLSDQKGAMMSDPKTKNLLIAASDLKPGTKAMDSVLKKIKANMSGGNQ